MVSLGVVALAAAWSDLVFELAPAPRLYTMAVALAVGVILAVVASRRAWREGGSGRLARRLDQVAGARGEIVSGVDLMDHRPDVSPLGAGLARIAIDRADVLVRDVPAARVVPVRPAVVAMLGVGSVAMLVALIALLMPRLALAQWLRFSDPYGDHPPYSPVVFEIEPGDVKVVYGQGIDVRAAVSGAPVDRLELVIESAGAEAERLPMFPEGQGRWRTTIANVTAAGRYFLQAQRARSSSHRIDVITVPRLTAVRFRITSPAYTRRSPYEGPLPAEGLAGLPGTRVDVWATSNRPLASGILRPASPSESAPVKLAPTASGSREVRGAFEIRREGKVEILVRDVDGQDSREPFSAQVVLLRDERPFVRIVEPRAVSFATPDAMLPVVLAAEDDYGLSRVQLFRALNGSRALPLDLPLGTEAPTRWNDQAYLPLPEYGLRAGDEIALFARVEDNDPAGAKGSESAVVTIKIIPRDVFERLVRAREGMDVLASKYREAARRLESLAEEAAQLQEELAKLPPDSPLAQEKQRALKALADRIRSEAAAIRESAKHVLPYDIDRKLSRELESLARSLDPLADEAEALAPRAGLSAGAAAKGLDGLRKRLAGGRKQFQDDALAPIEHLARIYPLLEDQARFVQLALRQRDLAGRMASLKGHDGEDNPRLKARMRDLEAEQKQLKDEFAQLLGDIEGHARLLPDDPRLATLRRTAEAFVSKARSCGASEAMADAEAGLAEFAGSRAHASAVKAADLLESLLAQCTGQGGIAALCEGCLKFQPALAGGLGNSIAQMLADAGLSLSADEGDRSGAGLGAGNGFSARGSQLNNVGLYGNLPTLTSSSGPGSGRTPGGSGEGRASRGGMERQPLETFAPGANARASGRAETVIPPQYRRRVADYFRRIADETGDR